MTTQTKWLTLDEAAAYCRCSAETLALHAKRRKVVACRSLDGNGWLFTIADLDKFIGDRVNK